MVAHYFARIPVGIDSDGIEEFVKIKAITFSTVSLNSRWDLVRNTLRAAFWELFQEGINCRQGSGLIK